MRTMIIAIATVLLASACTPSGEQTAEPLVIVAPTVPSGTVLASEQAEPAEQAPEPDVAPGPTVVTTISTTEAHPASTAPTSPVVTVGETTEQTVTSSAPPTGSLPSSTVAPESGVAPRAAPAAPLTVTATAAATGRAVDPVDLVGAATLSAVAMTTTVPCDAATADEPCSLASGVPVPPGDISVGEYQRNVPVDPDAELDIYFDQARPEPEMAAICRELGGQFTARGDDGSRWAGWYYCADVDH